MKGNRNMIYNGYTIQDLQHLYLENHSKLLLPSKKDGEPDGRQKQYAATVAANFASQGYVMSKEDIEELSERSVEDIVKFYQAAEPAVKDMLGGEYAPHPFYPDFPDEVIEKDRIEIFIDQVIYGMSGFEIKPEVYEKVQEAFPFMGKTTPHSLHLADDGEYTKDISDVCRSAMPFTKGQIEEIKEYMSHTLTSDEYAKGIYPKDEDVKQKENKIILGMLCKMTAKSREEQYFLLDRYMQDPVDVLRFAAAQSALRRVEKEPVTRETGYIKLEAALQAASFAYDKKDMPPFRLSRADRRYVIQTLEKMSISKDPKDRGQHRPVILASRMFSHRREWKKLINELHVDDMRKYGAKALARAAEILHKNGHIDRYESRVENAIQNGKFDTALSEARKRPGDFIRRFDKLLRMSIEQGKTDELLDALKEMSEKSGIAPTISLYKQIMGRDHNEESRAFKGKSGKIYTTTEKNRAAIPAPVREEIKDTCLAGMSEKFAGKGDMGKVYISPEMKNYAAPLAVRELNRGADVNTLGTTKTIDSDKDFTRFFVGWNNTPDSRVDIDLTCDLIKPDGRWAHIGWDGGYTDPETGGQAVIYSGDIQDGNPSGRNTYAHGSGAAMDCGCEYFDIKTKALREAGYQYAVIGATVYCGADSFADIPHCDFGYMERSKEERGELFEVKTVESKQKLDNKTRQFVPIVYDIANDRMISVNMDLAGTKNRMGTSRMSDSIDQIKAMLPLVAVEADSKFTVEDLVKVNAEKNGEIVSSPADADVLFMTEKEKQAYLEKYGEDSLDGKEIHSPTDYPYYTGVLLATPIEGQDLFSRKTEEKEQTPEHESAEKTDPFAPINERKEAAKKGCEGKLSENESKDRSSEKAPDKDIR